MRSVNVFIAAIAAAILSAAPAQTPLSTGFTYQGVLKQGGAPANGTHHLRFQLWDSLNGGVQVGSEIDLPSVSIANGLFSVELDFGLIAFNGSARWLQIQAVTNGGSTVTTLAPRQAVTAAPYALFALAADGPNLTNLNASNLATGTVPGGQLAGTYANALALTNASNTFAGSGAGLTSLNASNIASGTLGGSLLSGTYANALTLSNPANTFAGTYSGSGAAITNLNAANIASGSLAVERLPSGGAWPLSSTLNLDSNTLAIDAVNNRVGIGTASPAGPLHIANDIDPNMILHDSGSASTQTGYLSFRNNAFTETGWIGFGNPGSPTFSIVNQRSGGHILLAPFNSSSNVGIGTSAPTSKLEVHGDIRLGSSGQYRATSGEENLRIVRGVVEFDGSILAGSGFTVSHPSQGKYTITFTTAFTGRPSFTATTEYLPPPSAFSTTAQSQFVSSSSADLYTYTSSQLLNARFHFTAVGPR